MICKLCHKESKLVNSHILPEFVFKPLYDEKHRFHKITDDDLTKNSYLQKGIREKLLCLECEGLISKNEKYVSEVFGGIKEVNLENEGGLIKVEGLDYNKFKLFALSVLWRAGVSEVQSFSQVRLGKHEETLRQMVLKNNPGSSGEYPFVLTPIIYERELLSGLIAEPERVKLVGHISYRFVFSGLVWIYVVSSHALPKTVLEVSINESGLLKLIPKGIADLPFITGMAEDLSRRGKLDEKR